MGEASLEGAAIGRRAPASDRGGKIESRWNNRKYLGRLMGGTYHLMFGRGRT